MGNSATSMIISQTPQVVYWAHPQIPRFLQFFFEEFGQCPSPSWIIPHFLCLRNARAFPLLPAALASVPFGFVLVRVRMSPLEVDSSKIRALTEVFLSRSSCVIKWTPSHAFILHTRPESFGNTQFKAPLRKRQFGQNLTQAHHETSASARRKEGKRCNKVTRGSGALIFLRMVHEVYLHINTQGAEAFQQRPKRW